MKRGLTTVLVLIAVIVLAAFLSNATLTGEATHSKGKKGAPPAADVAALPPGNFIVTNSINTMMNIDGVAYFANQPYVNSLDGHEGLRIVFGKEGGDSRYLQLYANDPIYTLEGYRAELITLNSPHQRQLMFTAIPTDASQINGYSNWDATTRGDLYQYRAFLLHAV